jgi:arsenate reductase
MNQPNDGKPYNVLFLCTGNSARSIMAEALMNRLGAGKFRGYSAGSMPTGRVNPHTIALLQKLNYKTDQFRSKAWEEFSRDTIPDAPELNFVFTVCDNAAGEMCPIWPGQPMTAHWGIEDPAAVRGNDAEVALAFAEAYRQLNNRISTFVNLPLASLDRLALQTRLDEIGKTRVAHRTIGRPTRPRPSAVASRAGSPLLASQPR